MSFKSHSEIVFTDKFTTDTNWKIITDQVMGGVSQGQFNYQKIGDDDAVILTGNVSTKNNGGFIQIRRNLNDVNLNNVKKVTIIAKGNYEKYFIHLRTTFTVLPWQYYQSSFVVENNFKSFVLPLSDFKKFGYLLPKRINPNNIVSIAIVALGKDYDAKLIVKEISFVK
ncbi:CIA30 family protein [Alphaproteobacteria bacterium]|nr:CIA30 family protein [Alphaproteobacteria bacterium]